MNSYKMKAYDRYHSTYSNSYNNSTYSNNYNKKMCNNHSSTYKEKSAPRQKRRSKNGGRKDKLRGSADRKADLQS